MPSTFENIGFNITCEDDVYRLADFVINSGKILPAGDGAYACWSDASGAEIWERIALDHDTKSVSLLNIDPHFNGGTAWDLKLSQVLSAERDDELDFKAIMKKPDGEQFICARIMGALALPELKLDDVRTYQISMIPHFISFFEGEDNMRAALSDETSPLGSFAPLGFYSRMVVSEDDEEALRALPDILLTRLIAEVVAVSPRYMTSDGKPMGEFLHITLNTMLGPIDAAVGQSHYTPELSEKLAGGGYVAVIDGIISLKAVKPKGDEHLKV